MNKTIYKERTTAIFERADNIGAVVNHSFYDEDHLNCFWYDGNSIAEIEYKGYTICFDVCGDVSISAYADGDFNKEPKSWKHKSGGRPFFEDDDCRPAIVNDAVLSDLTRGYNLIFDNNNWINIVVIKKHGDTWDNVSEPEVAGESNLLDAVENNFDHYIKFIDDLIAKNKTN